MCVRKRFIGVIPSRFASTRLFGKPLIDICGIPMILHVYYRAKMSKLLDEVIVATDDERIYDLIQSVGGLAMMTQTQHCNGTERLCEVSQREHSDYYLLINGDEALLNPRHIDQCIQHLLRQAHIQCLLLYNKFYKRNSDSDFKVVLNLLGEVMYISRSDIPSESRNKVDFFYKAYHIVGFSYDLIQQYRDLEQTRCDKIESHELLRLLENGLKVWGLEVESSAISVDTSLDLEYVRSVMPNDKIFTLYA